jgi:hypothetical protein
MTLCISKLTLLARHFHDQTCTITSSRLHLHADCVSLHRVHAPSPALPRPAVFTSSTLPSPASAHDTTAGTHPLIARRRVYTFCPAPSWPGRSCRCSLWPRQTPPLLHTTATTPELRRHRWLRAFALHPYSFPSAFTARTMTPQSKCVVEEGEFMGEDIMRACRRKREA